MEIDYEREMEIRKLRDRGAILQIIANKFNISRQRVNQILGRDAYKKLRCLYCHGKFTDKQIKRALNHNTKPKYCSRFCKSQDTTIGLNTADLQNPTTTQQEKDFDKALAKGKAEITTEEQALVKSLTPIDDSPYAERKLREAVCPNPQYGNHVSLSKYDVRTKDMGHNLRSSYRE